MPGMCNDGLIDGSNNAMEREKQFAGVGPTKGAQRTFSGFRDGPSNGDESWDTRFSFRNTVLKSHLR